MVTVAITGAAGEVGREARRALRDHSVTCLTHRPHDDLESVVLDVTDRDAFGEALSAVDVLVHLAWGAAEREEWDGHAANVRGAVNAFEAARENGLDRVVFASSVHATGMYNREDPAEMESATDAPTAAVAADAPPRPDSYYGVAKVACEAAGRYYADRYGLEVVTLRIGWLMDREELLSVQADAPDRARFARATWLSPRDCRDALRAAALAPLEETPVTANVVSRNGDRFHSLAEGMVRLGYRPRDDATEALEVE